MVCTVICASCTDLSLARYQDAALKDRAYALGENYVQVDNVRLCYQERGHGPDILIVPGLLTDLDFWQETIPVLAEHYHVWAVDLPGCGKSDKPNVPYDLPWIRDRLIGFMDCMHIEHASLIGGSLGGHLAMMIALEAPQRVDKLILMGSSGAWTQPTLLVSIGLHTLWNEAIVTDHLRRNWPSIHGKMFARQSPLTRRIFARQMALRADGRAFAPEGRAATRALRSIFFNSVLDRLPRITTPTLLLWGEHDQWHLRSEALTLRAGLPNAHLIFIPDCGHEVMVDQPQEFNRLTLAFLAGGLNAVGEAAGHPLR